MCFNPAISLGTCIVEFILATYILLRYRKTSLALFSSLVLYVLGLYQFTEFMVCTSNSPLLWAKIGFMVYSFLPALGLHEICAITKRKFPRVLLYVIPVAFSLFALLQPTFIVQATCNTVFVTISNILTHSTLGIPGLLSILFLTYYIGYILLFCLILASDSFKTKEKKQRIIYRLIVLSVLLMTLPTLIFIIIFPMLSIRFASVLCHFALLLAITLFYAVYLENKK